MVVRMGEREGVVTLVTLRRRLDIADRSPDGQMLDRIGEALDFVNEIHPGDPFPAEILSGEASWQPDAGHRHIATRQLREKLIQWLHATGTPGSASITAADFDRADRDPVLRERIHAAFDQVANQLGLPDVLGAITALENLTSDLAYIEALRERLLVTLRQTARKLDLIGRDRHGSGANTEMLTMVRRLCQTALQRIGQRLSIVDALSDDIIAALGGGSGQQTLIRSCRDWLYRTQRVFAPILAEWDAAPAEIDEQFWGRLARTHRLLAPRFMILQEWKRFRAPGGA